MPDRLLAYESRDFFIPALGTKACTDNRAPLILWRYATDLARLSVTIVRHDVTPQRVIPS